MPGIEIQRCFIQLVKDTIWNACTCRLVSKCVSVAPPAIKILSIEEVRLKVLYNLIDFIYFRANESLSRRAVYEASILS